ncbi:cell wall biogenesis protein/glutathione transferase (Gto1), partial [Aspergillus flavus]
MSHIYSALRRTQQISQFITQPRIITSYRSSVSPIQLLPSSTRTFELLIEVISLQTGNADKITDWVSRNDKSGEFKRQTSIFRNWISREAGAEFPPEKDRYHLYVSYACPW